MDGLNGDNGRNSITVWNSATPSNDLTTSEQLTRTVDLVSVISDRVRYIRQDFIKVQMVTDFANCVLQTIPFRAFDVKDTGVPKIHYRFNAFVSQMVKYFFITSRARGIAPDSL